MGIKSLCFLLTIILFSSFCHGDNKTIISEVVGHGDCADCVESNIKSSQAFSGIHVTIDCKAPNGEIKTRGEGNLDDEGKFIVSLPQEILENGKLKEECFANLHSASRFPCPSHNGLDSSKMVFKTKTDGKHIFTIPQKLKFYSTTCSSKTFLKHFTYPPLPKWKKHFPFYKKPCPPLPPIFKKPLPPMYKPTPKPNTPVYKPNPKPPVVYKPPPYVKPLPPPVPVYKPKPEPKPPVYKPKPKPPVYEPKPKPPVYEPKPKPPVYKSPPYVKPLPPPIPFYPFPKIHKKPPCPPLPKLKYPKIPPKYFHHPIFAPWPPHSP